MASGVAGSYVLEAELGEGSQGVVYRARHRVLDKLVALKILHKSHAGIPAVAERVLVEAKAAARIGNPHIVDVCDYGVDDEGRPFFVMELMDGSSLASVLEQTGPMPFPRARRIVAQICDALQAAHEAGVVHRDLKPENVFLVESSLDHDFVKILDFGIAKVHARVGAAHRPTRPGLAFGTPWYMAPEQIRGESIDGRVDVYSAGCILYQLLAGRVPYDGEHIEAIFTGHFAKPIPKLGVRAVDAVLARAMAKSPADRYPSMTALAEDLAAIDLTPQRRRFPRTLGAIGLAAALAALALPESISLPSLATAAPAPAPVPAAAPVPVRLPLPPASSPDGSWVPTRSARHPGPAPASPRRVAPPIAITPEPAADPDPPFAPLPDLKDPFVN